MKRFVVAFVAVVAVLAIGVAPAGAFNRTKKRVPGPTRILLVGDSITWYYEQTVADQHPDAQVIQWGVPTTGLLDTGVADGTWARDLVALYDPDIVVVEYTGNYLASRVTPPLLAYGSKEWFAAWKLAAKKSRAAFVKRGAKVDWVLVPTITALPQATSVAKINKIYRQVGAKDGLIDAYTAFGGPYYNPYLHLADGLHPNPAGIDVFASQIRATIG